MPAELATTPSAPVGAVVQVALATTVAACALGAVYGFVVAWVPYAHLLAFAGAAIVGYLIALVCEQCLVAGRVRHRGVTLWVPMIAAVFGYYVAWVAWVAGLHDHRAAVSLLWRPADLALTIAAIGDGGAWPLMGWRPGRFESWVSWITECLLFFGGVHIGSDAAAQRLAPTR